MKTLWILAAAATFAACHNRPNDETGAAPDRGDTTMTTPSYDTTAAPSADTSMATPSYDTTTTPSAGYDTTSTTPPSAGYDTTSSNPSGVGTDTTMGGMGNDTSSTSDMAPDTSTSR